jgi:LacI family transcriptional regulator
MSKQASENKNNQLSKPRSDTLPVKRTLEEVVSIQMVAEKAGVSIATISRVLNGNRTKVSEATRERVLSVIAELGYRPSGAGSALRSGRSRMVALMVPEPTNAYNGAIANAVERKLRERGKILLFCNTQEDPGIQDELLKEMRAQVVSGIIMLGAVESEGLRACVTGGDPIVFVNRRPAYAPPGVFVGIDNHASGRMVATHFRERGFSRTWLVHGPLTSAATAERVQGFLGHLADAGAPPPVKIFETSRSRMEAGYELASQQLSKHERPEAIFCTTDELAYGVFKRCTELGIDVPQDIHLFGFDGNPLNEYLAPWLGTIRVPYEEFGGAVTAALEHFWSEGVPPEKDAVFPVRLLASFEKQRK